MKSQRYNLTARVLHWLSAGVIVWATLSGFFLAALENGTGLREWISWFNVSLTTAFIPLFVYRAINAAVSTKPRVVEVSRWQQLAARGAHAGLYALTAIVLVSGVLMMEKDISVFDLLTIPRPVSSAAVNAFFYKAHRYTCTALFVLVVVHIGAVIGHHRQGRRILRRMT